MPVLGWWFDIPHIPSPALPCLPSLKNTPWEWGGNKSCELFSAQTSTPCPSCAPGFTFCFPGPARLVVFIDNTQFLGDIFIRARVQIDFCSCRSFSSPLSSMCWELISTLVHLCLMGTFIPCAQGSLSFSE